MIHNLCFDVGSTANFPNSLQTKLDFQSPLGWRFILVLTMMIMLVIRSVLQANWLRRSDFSFLTNLLAASLAYL